MDTQLARSLDLLSDIINPALIVALIVAPLVANLRAGNPPPWSFWARSALAILLVYLVAHFDRRLDLWPRLGLDYSTHSALALAVAVSLAFFNRRWLWLLLPLLFCYALLMLALGYHSIADMITTALVIVPLTAGCHLIKSTLASRRSVATLE